MVLVFGTICLDRMRMVSKLPGPGGYVGVESECVMLGGEAANTALALHAWGADFILVGNRLGSGPDAECLVGKIRAAGLPFEYLSRGGTRTPICEIYVTPDGDRTMFGLGFDTIADGCDFEAVPFPSGGWFTADMNLGWVAREAARRANSSGMNGYLMDFVEADEPILKGAYWQSSTDWMGRRGDREANLSTAERISRQYCCTAILTDGARGLYVAADGAARLFPAFPAARSVDSTGAGDMFRSGMLFGLNSGLGLGESLRFAAAAASLNCERLGAARNVPSLADIDERISAFPEISDRYGSQF